MSDRAEKAFEEMLDISTDMDKAILFSGDEILASNFPENLNAAMLGKATELSVMGNARAEDTSLGMVFLVKEADAAGMGVLATGKKDSRIGLVFYDMKTCIRDAQEEEDTEASEE